MGQNAKNYEFVSYEEFEKIQLEENQHRLEYDIVELRVKLNLG